MVNPPIQMANLGMADTMILMVMALVVFGPRRLPQIGRQIGKLMYEFRKASNDFKFQMEEELRTSEDAERRKKEEDRQLAMAAAATIPGVVKVTATEILPAEPAAAELGPGELEQGEYAPVMEPTIPLAELLPPSPDDGVYSPGEETGLRVSPPSVGEQVAAARPGSRVVASAAEQASAAEPEAVIEPEAPQAAHHG